MFSNKGNNFVISIKENMLVRLKVAMERWFVSHATIERT